MHERRRREHRRGDQRNIGTSRFMKTSSLAQKRTTSPQGQREKNRVKGYQHREPHPRDGKVGFRHEDGVRAAHAGNMTGTPEETAQRAGGHRAIAPARASRRRACRRTRSPACRRGERDEQARRAAERRVKEQSGRRHQHRHSRTATAGRQTAFPRYTADRSTVGPGFRPLSSSFVQLVLLPPAVEMFVPAALFHASVTLLSACLPPLLWRPHA